MHYQNRKVFTTTWISIQTFLAGAINVYAVFMLEKTISHHTGSISKAAIALANGNWLLAFHLVSYLLLFFVGAFFSGLTTYKRNRGVRLLHSVSNLVWYHDHRGSFTEVSTGRFTKNHGLWDGFAEWNLYPLQ